MRGLKCMAFGGAAVWLLAGAANAVSPANERAQTRELNLQQSQMAQENSQTRQLAIATDVSTANAPPAAVPTRPVEMAAAIPVTTAGAAPPLSTLVNPPEQIADASIADSSGRIVGAMQRVNLADGKPTSAEIALLGAQDHLVVIDAAEMTYNAAKNIVTVQASGDQLRAMPAKG